MSETPNDTPEVTPDQKASPAPAAVECPAGKDPAVRIFIFAGMLVAFGIYSIYDLHFTDKYPYAPITEDINKFGYWAFNAFGAYICTPAGVIIAVLGALFLKRVLVADGEGIGYRGKAKRPWSDVSKLDATQLRDKGILTLHFKDGGRLKLDSWKLQNFKRLVMVVEDNVPKAKE